MFYIDNLELSFDHFRAFRNLLSQQLSTEKSQNACASTHLFT